MKNLNNVIFENIDLLEYDLICIDYLELFDIKKIKSFIQQVIDKNLRLMITTQMKKSAQISNIFEVF